MSVDLRGVPRIASTVKKKQQKTCFYKELQFEGQLNKLLEIKLRDTLSNRKGYIAT